MDKDEAPASPKDAALKLALEYIETNAHERRNVRWAIKEALAQPVQEPVGQVGEDKHGLVGDIYDDRKVKIGDKLYTSLPQRQWVGLTDEEVDNFLKASWGRGVTPEHLIQAIDAKLKEKNT